MKLLLLPFFCVLGLVLYGQDQTYFQSDSLRRELARAKDDTTKILLQSRLSESYRSAKPDSALFLAELALNESRRIHYARGEANALIVTSVLQRELGNLSLALDAGIKALRIAREHELRYGNICFDPNWQCLSLGPQFYKSHLLPQGNRRKTESLPF